MAAVVMVAAVAVTWLLSIPSLGRLPVVPPAEKCLLFLPLLPMLRPVYILSASQIILWNLSPWTARIRRCR
jgi:hypothetical protein